MNHIHFLRPVWLWGFSVVAILVLLLFLSSKQKESWRSSIANELLPHLIVKGDGLSFLPKIFLILLLSTMVLALAGPAWKKVETPGGEVKAALVILVDASESMLSTDIAPDRLTRAKQKIEDLLKASPGTHVAVVAYAGTAHTLIPFTTDYKSIHYQLEALTPKVMPVPGTSLELAMNLADSLLMPVEAPSTILIFTDNVTDKNIQTFSDRSSSLNRAEFVLLATPSGAPIPLGRGRFKKDKNGQIVIPKLDVDKVKEIGKLPNVSLTTYTLDDSDVKRLAQNIRRNLLYEKNAEEKDEEWQDAGYWLLIPMFFFILFWFRRGWVVQWCIVVIASVSLSGCSNTKGDKKIGIEPLPEKVTFKDLWYTRDQQGQQLLDEGSLDEALATFTDPWQKAAVLYEQGKLEEAASIYSTIPTARSYFNLGVIYVDMESWVQARKAFQQAIDAQPDFIEAEENLSIVNAIIKEITSRYGKVVGAEDKNRQEAYSEEKTELNELKDELEGDEEQTSGGQKQEQSGGLEAGGQPKDDLLVNEDAATTRDEVKDMILRQLSDDPALFMQRKFRHQVLTGKVERTELDNTW